MARIPGATYAISNTGPLISAFQSDSVDLLLQLFAEIHLSTICANEMAGHGWEENLRIYSAHLIIVELTSAERRRASLYARQIAQHPDTHDPMAASHLGEAQAIVLAQRPDYQNDVLLLDELAARAVARQRGLKLSGFPGALLLAVQGGLITPEELRRRLEVCRQQGTHYGTAFIQQVYEMAQGRRR
jgi:predicted nucleic acid-binding protein